jgi:hypothetical protein
MSDAPRISYTPCPGATAETELDALAVVYAFILKKHRERKKATERAPAPDGYGEHKRLVDE